MPEFCCVPRCRCQKGTGSIQRSGRRSADVFSKLWTWLSASLRLIATKDYAVRCTNETKVRSPKSEVRSPKVCCTRAEARPRLDPKSKNRADPPVIVRMRSEVKRAAARDRGAVVPPEAGDSGSRSSMRVDKRGTHPRANSSGNRGAADAAVFRRRQTRWLKNAFSRETVSGSTPGRPSEDSSNVQATSSRQGFPDGVRFLLSATDVTSAVVL